MNPYSWMLNKNYNHEREQKNMTEEIYLGIDLNISGIIITNLIGRLLHKTNSLPWSIKWMQLIILGFCYIINIEKYETGKLFKNDDGVFSKYI